LSHLRGMPVYIQLLFAWLLCDIFPLFCTYVCSYINRRDCGRSYFVGEIIHAMLLPSQNRNLNIRIVYSIYIPYVIRVSEYSETVLNTFKQASTGTKSVATSRWNVCVCVCLFIYTVTIIIGARNGGRIIPARFHIGRWHSH